jgi:hypothetical protein
LNRTAKSAAKPVGLARIDTEDQSVDLKLKLKGKLASELNAYREAYAEAHGHPVDLEALAPQMLASFMASDRNFQGWLKRRAQGRDAS